MTEDDPLMQALMSAEPGTAPRRQGRRVVRQQRVPTTGDIPQSQLLAKAVRQIGTAPAAPATGGGDIAGLAAQRDARVAADKARAGQGLPPQTWSERTSGTLLGAGHNLMGAPGVLAKAPGVALGGLAGSGRKLSGLFGLGARMK